MWLILGEMGSTFLDRMNGMQIWKTKRRKTTTKGKNLGPQSPTSGCNSHHHRCIPRRIHQHIPHVRQGIHQYIPRCHSHRRPRHCIQRCTRTLDPICFRRLCPCPGILCLASTQCHHHLQCLATCILHPGGRPSSYSQTPSTPVRRHWTNEAVKKPYMDLSAKQEVEWNKNKKKLGAMRKRSRTTTPSSWRLWQLPHGMDTQSLMSQMKTAAQKTGKQRSTRRRRKRRVRRKRNRRISQKRESDRGAGRGRKRTGSRSLDVNSIPGKELAATNAVSTRICCALKKKMLRVCVCVGDWEGPLGEQ